jgi:putative transcriptional regulator
MRLSFFRAADVRCPRVAPVSPAVRARRVPLLLATLVLGLAPALIVPAQEKPPQNQPGDKGLFLIARRELSDPFFAKSTVLMLPVEPSPLVPVVGLIINKPTHVSLHELFPHARALQKDDATAYFGGPVDIHDRSAIFRSSDPPEHALHIFADVYVTFDSDAIGALVKKSQQPSLLRIFLGRSQWGPAQLQYEVLEGAWYSLRLNADPIFSGDPGKIWQTLLERVEPSPYVDRRPPSRELFARRSSGEK